MKKLILISLYLLFASTMALGHWNVGDPAKWVQLPDLDPTGIDVRATDPKILADDFLCETSGYITGAHIWASWKDDQVVDPGLVSFNLSIYSNIPASPDNLVGPKYSMPGELLWNRFFAPDEFTVRRLDDAPEGWYNPNTGEYLPNNHTMVYQYNFVAPPDVDPKELFHQEEGTVYWLGIVAFPEDPRAVFGWKTSTDHWNDDAVWGEPPNPLPIIGWQELHYPDGHPYMCDTIDLAFVIVPEPATIALLGFGSLSLILRRRRVCAHKKG